MAKMLDYHVSELQVPIFAVTGDHVQILDVKGRETARVMLAEGESVEDLTKRANLVSAALNIVFQEAR